MLSNAKRALIITIVVGLTASVAQNSSAASGRKPVQPTLPGKANKQSSKKTLVYKNKEFRFRFTLPESWKGYSIVAGKWKGGRYIWQDKSTREEEGPSISIKHPLDTTETPRQDIPIMVYTHAQWDLIETGTLIVSAAPIIPREIGRNARYVFAVPARYNYALLTGYEEVEDLLSQQPLHSY